MSEGLYPPESCGVWARLGRHLFGRAVQPPMTREFPDEPRLYLTARATINLADIERHVAAVKAGGTGEGVPLPREHRPGRMP